MRYLDFMEVLADETLAEKIPEDDHGGWGGFVAIRRFRWDPRPE